MLMTTADLKRLSEHLGSISGRTVLVLGDAMLDHYIWGDALRISPEAPVPVVKVERESQRLGGAANVAHNVRSLGGTPLLVSVTGDDNGGRLLRSTLERHEIDTAPLVTDPDRPTIKKTRLVARGQQVVRIDREQVSRLGDAPFQRLAQQVESLLPKAEAVLISDYGKGVICRRLLDAFLPRFREQGLPVCVDPKETHFHSYKQVTILTPNKREASFAAGQPITDDESLEEVGQRLLAGLQAENLLITRGEEGMSLFRAGQPTVHISAAGRDVYDVTGAGDTVISTLALGLAARVPVEDVTRLANHAASRVIRELGTATTSLDEIRASLATAALVASKGVGDDPA